MRNKILIATAAAFLMSGVVSAAYAAPPFSEIKKDDEKKNPTTADVDLAKTEAKDAKKKAHKAEHKAKVAEGKAKSAAKDADKAAAAAQ